MKKGVIQAIIGLIVAASLVAAGCGGDGDDGTSVTKAQFVKQANAACTETASERGKMLKRASELVKPGEKVQTDAFREKLIDTILLPNYGKQIERLKALDPPEGEEEEVEKIIAGMDLAVERIERNPLPAFYNVTQFKEANERSAKYGLDKCMV